MKFPLQVVVQVIANTYGVTRTFGMTYLITGDIRLGQIVVGRQGNNRAKVGSYQIELPVGFDRADPLEQVRIIERQLNSAGADLDYVKRPPVLTNDDINTTLFHFGRRSKVSG